MRTPNIQAIRDELPHGSMSVIANKVGVSNKIVSEFFSKGWHQEHSTAILAEAIEIIKGKYPDEELLEEIEQLGLTGGYHKVQPKLRKKTVERDDDDGEILGLIAVAGAVALLFWPQIKGWLNKEKDKKERIAEIVRKANGK